MSDFRKGDMGIMTGSWVLMVSTDKVKWGTKIKQKQKQKGCLISEIDDV